MTVSEPAAFDVAVIEVDSKLGVVTSETTILVAEVESAGDLDLNGAVEIDYEDGTATDTADIQEVNLTFEDVPDPTTVTTPARTPRKATGVTLAAMVAPPGATRLSNGKRSASPLPSGSWGSARSSLPSCWG
ncbi:hypothetical protein [Halobellus ruber]|uniref:Uncharacterized protein n=1 Tax=Halobellus ruber TaxID=2761102 RepID=A0A7J9SHQ6_9EURY|nr:hypothetical protein [Halobellus ruber]MBB6646494.1 hypothetical protein [Halobellus ruber]